MESLQHSYWAVRLGARHALPASCPQGSRRGSPCRAPSTARWPGIRACPAASPPWCRAMPTTTRSSFAPTMPAPEIADRRRAAFERLSRQMRTGCARTLEQTAEAAPHISDLQFTESYRVPFQFSPRSRPAARRVVLASSDGVQVTDLDGNARYDLAGSYGVNLLGYDFYKGCMERGAAARRRARAGAGLLPVAGRRQRRAAGADLGQGRGLVPHVGHRSGHAGRPAGALSHQALPSRALLRRLSRLVGRRAARRRQPGAGARHLHPGRHVGAHPGGAAHPPRHRLRAGQSGQALYPNLGAPANSTLVHSRPDRASTAPPIRPG